MLELEKLTMMNREKLQNNIIHQVLYQSILLKRKKKDYDLFIYLKKTLKKTSTTAKI